MTPTIGTVERDGDDLLIRLIAGPRPVRYRVPAGEVAGVVAGGRAVLYDGAADRLEIPVSRAAFREAVRVLEPGDPLARARCREGRGRDAEGRC